MMMRNFLSSFRAAEDDVVYCTADGDDRDEKKDEADHDVDM